MHGRHPQDQIGSARLILEWIIASWAMLLFFIIITIIRERASHVLAVSNQKPSFFVFSILCINALAYITFQCTSCIYYCSEAAHFLSLSTSCWSDCHILLVTCQLTSCILNSVGALYILQGVVTSPRVSIIVRRKLTSMLKRSSILCNIYISLKSD